MASRQARRKLHIVIDEKHQIIAYDITDNSKGDQTTAVDLLDQIKHAFVELCMLRYKKVIGPSMKARDSATKNRRWDSYARIKPNDLSWYAGLCKSELETIRLE